MVHSQALRWVGLVLAAGGLGLVSLSGKPAAALEGEVAGLWAGLEREERRQLEEALGDERVIPPEAALAAARKFLGERRATFKLLWFSDQDDFGHGPDYFFEAAGLARGDLEGRVNLCISPIDGKTHYLGRVQDPVDPGPAVVSRADAEAAAERFLRAGWPEFTRRRWVQDGPPLPEEEDAKVHGFAWTEVLDESGVRAALNLAVQVDRHTGRIANCWFPRDQLGGPTTPRVTLEQAKRLAAPNARRDPSRFPFRNCYLQQSVASYGVVNLMWKLYQDVPEGEGHDGPHLAYVQLNAMTGQEIWTPDGPGPDAPWRGPLRELARETERELARPGVVTVEVFHGDGRPVWQPIDPEARDGDIWLRIELLRGLNTRLFGSPSRRVLRYRDRRVTAEEVGAQFREGGWWVPLSRVSRAFGWRLRKNPQYRSVAVVQPEIPE